MGVYIDREQAIKCLDGNVLITRQSEAEAVKEYFEMVVKRLESVPTVDLVRCGECRYYNPLDEDRLFSCEYDGREVNKTDFCSYGERRTDEN